VLCCLNSEFTNKINKITKKTNKMTKIIVFLTVLYMILLIFFVKTTEHTVASYESSDFIRKFSTVFFKKNLVAELKVNTNFHSYFYLKIIKYGPNKIWFSNPATHTQIIPFTMSQ
jgi:hypothetical protein